MKRWIHAASSISDTKSRISDEMYAYIKYDLWPQTDYYKQIRKQFTVNGRKYIIKNDKNGHLNIISPEGENLYGYAIPNRISSDLTNEIAIRILNDAYGDDIDLDNKSVYLNVRYGYTEYGRNSSGKVTFGPYLETLKRNGERQETFTNVDAGDVNARYVSVQIKAMWSNHDDYIFFSDDANDLINSAKKFIHEGANSYSKDSDMGEVTYYYYADVIDTETGEELYFDSSESKSLE